MRKLAMGLCALVLAATAPAFGQNTNAGTTQLTRDRLADFRLSAAGTCTTGASAARLDSTGLGSLGVTVTGTFVGTLTFKAAIDDSITYNTVNAYPQAGGAVVTTATSTGSWFVAAPAGYKWFCLYFSAYTSGTAVVHLEGSARSQSLVQATGLVADGVAIAGAPVPIGVKAVAEAAQPSAVAAGQVAYPIATLERIPVVTTRHPNHIQCQQTISTATTLTAMGGSCAAPGAGLSIYITDISFSTNAAGITADSFNTLKSGTGGSCGTATAVIWQCMTTAATQATCSQNLQTPIKVTANSEVCWINSTAGSKTVNIEGYIAP